MLIRGEVWIWKNGVLIRHGKNLVTSAGFTLLASIIGAAGTKPSHMAVGSSGAASTLAMTSLQGTEHQRKAVTTTVVDRTVSYAVSAFGPGLGGSVSVSEIGVFNNAVGGTMLCRFTTLAFTIGPTDTIPITWQVTIGD